jgi:aromatic-L-amino-acid/L-tryptophan decarboxylase
MSDRQKRDSPLEIDPADFRKLGKDLTDRIADFLVSLPDRPVTRGEPPSEIRRLMGGTKKLPRKGVQPATLLEEASELLFEHSLFNGHPRFWGYVTSSAAPIGAFGDFLAASVNPNVGAWALSPMATEIERQTVGWVAEMIGYPTDCGGLLVSGGNMANFVAFLVAIKSKATWNIQKRGVAEGKRLVVYASRETHGWITKAAGMFGLGTDSIRWVPTDENLRVKAGPLKSRIKEDLRRGRQPFLVVGNAGTVQTGAIDPLDELSEVCKEYDLWFHVDGAYGAFGAVVPELSQSFIGMERADSIAVDPHKWLYTPLEAGCVLVRDERALHNTFSHHPAYYRFSRAGTETPTNYYEYGPQNSRSFRALKVWLALRQVGRDGYERMIREDIHLAEHLLECIKKYRELEPLSQSLSITTFRYVPKGVKTGTKNAERYLNKLNEELLSRLQSGGEAFPSNAVIHGKFALRVCIVNFRTSAKDVESLPEIVLRAGRALDAESRKS